MTVNDEQWSLIHDKYSNLMWKISHNISGDAAISSPEDNYADLQVAALEAVAGFQKKTGRVFDEFWGEKLFDQYIKTCLWNLKNNKGGKIAKKYPLTKHTVDITENEEVLNIDNNACNAVKESVFLNEISFLLSSHQRKILNMVAQDPMFIKPNGKINKSRLSRHTGLSWRDVDSILSAMSRIIGNEL